MTEWERHDEEQHTEMLERHMDTHTNTRETVTVNKVELEDGNVGKDRR